jgi:nucleoid-associated protein YgaU
MYRIQENDTLTDISLRHLGRSSRWIQIYELNRDNLANPNQLKIGTMLKLPGDASRVRIVRGK